MMFTKKKEALELLAIETRYNTYSYEDPQLIKIFLDLF